MIAHLILRLVLPMIIAVTVSPGSYGKSINSNIIGIYSAEDLNLIGNNFKYPVDGDYQLMNSIDASGFCKPYPLLQW